MKRTALFLTAAILVAACTCSGQLIQQLPDQLYYANETCEYVVADYTQAIRVTDNCRVAYFYQWPESGTVIGPDSITTVSIVAGDGTGNESTIRFNILVIDTLPPVFEIDTVLFNSLSHYQNEYQRWHLHNWVTATGDTLDSPEGFGLWGYYTAREVMNIEKPKCHPVSMSFVSYDSLPEGHPLLEDIPLQTDRFENITGTYNNAFREGYAKRSYYTAEYSYEIKWIKIYATKQGNPNGAIQIAVIDEVGDTLSSGVLPYDQILDAPHRDWAFAYLSPGIIQSGKQYAIEVIAPGTDDDNLVYWVSGESPEDRFYLQYSYDGGTTWGTNHNQTYLFKLYGYELQSVQLTN